MAGPNTISLTRTERYSNMRAEEHSQMRRDSVFTDFTIYTHDEKFPCHKMMVAALSPVLKAMLTSDIEVAKHEVRLNHIRGEILDLVLDYIYCGHISFDTSQLMDMLKASHHLQIQELIEMCVGEAPAIITPKTVLSWLELCQKLELDDLQAQSMQFMIENFIDVLNEPAFLSFSIIAVQDFFSNSQGPTSNHDAMLSAAMRWVSHDTASRAQHLEELMEKVSLDKCSHPALLEALGKYGAVTGLNLSILNMIMHQNGQQDVAQKEVKTVQNILSPTTTPTADQQVRTKKMARTAKAKQMLVIVGGTCTVKLAASNACWKMNDRHRFETLTEIPADDLAWGHSVCATDEGFIVTGGEDSDICYIYTAATMSWRRVRKMLRKRRWHGSICIKGVLYVLGGWIDWRSTNSVDCLVLTQGHWETGPDLPQNLPRPKVAEINDRLYLLDHQTKKLYQLDVDNKVWTERAPIPGCDEYVGMVSVKGKLAVMGGRTMICALYDPTTDVWTVGQQPRYEHWDGSLVYLDDRLLLMGGLCDIAIGGTNEVEEYSLDDGTWSATDIKMPANLWRYCALVLVLDSPHNG